MSKAKLVITAVVLEGRTQAEAARTYGPSPAWVSRLARPRHHQRVRHDRIDTSGVVTLRIAGRLHHIGIGRTHARTHVILLIHDLHVRVIAATTGEILRELNIDTMSRVK